MPPHLLVERALALVPECEEFLPLTDAVIGTSHVDGDKRWDRSSAYATVGKRVVDSSRLAEVIPRVLEREQRRLSELFGLVLQAVQEQEEGHPAAAAATLIQAGEREEADRRLDHAERIYAMALEISRDLRDKGPQVLALRRLGRATRAAGRLEEAWSWYEQSHQLSFDQLDVTGQAIACQGLGNVCDGRGERERARAWYERGLALARGLDDPALEWPFYANLSVLAILDGELAEAEALLDRAQARVEAAGDEGAVPYLDNNRGLLRLEHGDAVGAEKAFREGLDRGPDGFWEMTIRVNLGQALVRQGRHFEAEEEARRAEEIAVVNRFIPDLVDVYDLLGTIARARCDEEGFVFYEEALRVCHERGLPAKFEAAVYAGYGRLHLACGRPAEGRAYLDHARGIYEELGFGRELERVMGDLEGIEERAVAAG